MKAILFLCAFISVNMILMSCNGTVNCERHFLPKGFTGRVTIYFNQKNGQKDFDRDGCRVYQIDKKGNCFSSLSLQQGSAYPNKTLKFFEIIGKDSLNQIFEFDENEYLKDTIRNKERKYAFWYSSGYSYPNYTFEYDIDYGKNYKNHFYVSNVSKPE